MAHGSKRHRSKRHRHHSDGFGNRSNRGSRPLLVRATDACFWTTFFGVTVCFGGRAAAGQLIMVVGAMLTAVCWLLHRITSRKTVMTWTGSEWLWLAGIAVGVVQIVPLPQEWVLAVSPTVKQLLPPASVENVVGPANEVWNQLSLSPWESASGLATFVAYAMLFLVIAQRLQKTSDVERMMVGVAIVAVTMAVFSQLQYLTSNGKYYWFYLHPFVGTDIRPTGCFTNRNHLAQFLAMGIAPLIWWLLRKLAVNDSEQVDSASSANRRSLLIPLGIALGLGCTVLTALSTLSRGGLLAAAVATVVCIGLFWRLRLVSVMLCVGLVLVASVIGAIFNFSGDEASLAARLEHDSGREQVWLANIAVTREFPILGTGIGTHANANWLHLEKPKEGYEYTHAESSYLQVMSETGFVGLGLAALFIIVSLWWCWAAFRNPDVRVSSIAAVVMASLLTNLSHAVGDFFWYTPSCMLFLTIQLACVCRLYQNSKHGSRESETDGRESADNPPVSGDGDRESAAGGRAWNLRRLIAVPALGGTLAAGAWMIWIKLPEALAEPDKMQTIALSLDETAIKDETEVSEEEEEKNYEVEHEMRQAALSAARIDPRDARFQEAAADAYLKLFSERQFQSENPMTLEHLRDVLRASDFESPAAKQEWLNGVVGKNQKLIDTATKYLRQALHQSPLRAYAYVRLAELGFLTGMDKETEVALLKHALVLRPHDPEVLYSAGASFLLRGDVEGAMYYWREAFQLGPKVRIRIIELLSGQVSAEFILTNLKPEWPVLHPLAKAFEAIGRDDEAKLVWQKCLDGGPARLKEELTREEREQAYLAIRGALMALDQPNRAIAVLKRIQRQMPNSMAIRSQLAWDLFATERYAEAAEHLQWCAARVPENKLLQQAAAFAVKERLREAGRTESSDQTESAADEPRSTRR
jgi:O-antigen ligase/tetratricopeptide (TPR) repeat protein